MKQRKYLKLDEIRYIDLTEIIAIGGDTPDKEKICVYLTGGIYMFIAVKEFNEKVKPYLDSSIRKASQSVTRRISIDRKEEKKDEH